MKNLNQKLAVIQTKLKAKKSSYNSFGKYYFRKAEDILEAAKPFLIENSVSITITEEVIPGHTVPIVQSTAIISDGENSIQATAVVGVDLNQKGMQTAQQFGAASTYGTEDADATNTHGRASQIVNKVKAEMTADQLKKAIEFVKGGGAISSIETKYNVTEKQMKTLQNG